MALTSDFVAAVRRQGSIPSSVTDTTLLAMGDEEIQGRFIPLLEVLRQNFFIREITATPDARGRIPLPVRAVGAALRNVQVQVGGTTWTSLPLRALEEADSVSASALPAAYYLDAGSICLLPNGSTGTLRIRYAARPGKMKLNTDLTQCAIITAVAAGVTPGTTALSGMGAFTPSVALFDIISSGPAHQAKAIGTTFALPETPTANLLEYPIVGDYLCAFDTSPFVPLPEELFSALVHSVAANVLLSKGYLEEAGAQESKAAACVSQARAFLMPRNEGNPQVISGGLRRALRGGASRRGGRW